MYGKLKLFHTLEAYLNIYLLTLLVSKHMKISVYVLFETKNSKIRYNFFDICNIIYHDDKLEVSPKLIFLLNWNAKVYFRNIIDHVDKFYLNFIIIFYCIFYYYITVIIYIITM